MVYVHLCHTCGRKSKWGKKLELFAKLQFEESNHIGTKPESKKQVENSAQIMQNSETKTFGNLDVQSFVKE